MEFFKRTKIRIKVLLAFSSIILLSILLTVYAVYAINDIISLERLNKTSSTLLLTLEQLELAAQKFIADGYKDKKFQESGRTESTDQFNNALKSANLQLDVLMSNNEITDFETREKIKFLHSSTLIHDNFDTIKSLLKSRGFRDFGLEGSLRRAIHKIENSSLPYDKTTLLTLRRHEKDFFLRKDLKYQKDFNETISGFQQQLNESTNLELQSLLNNYQSEFNQVVKIEQIIGLNENSGMKGELNTHLNQARELIGDINNYIQTTTTTKINRAKALLLVIFLVQVILAIILALTYANVLTKVIKEIKVTMTELANGVFPAPLSVNTSEEIGQTKIAINQFLDRLKVATTFADNLGNGKLNATYDNRYTNDVFAKSLISMQQKLNEAEQAQGLINWANKGLSLFNEIANNETQELSTLGDNILNVLVKYMNANQGVLYIADNQSQSFQRLSTYAYHKKRFIDDTINFGSGLIGQCAQEQQTIYLKEIPKNYIKITSGLGEATPTNILLTPLKVRDNLMGVLELASFELFEQHHIAFIEKVAENIAFILFNRQSSFQTKLLLEESERKASELIQREEQLRQNSEELLATQEEMERQRDEMQREIESLQKRLLHYENFSSELTLR